MLKELTVKEVEAILSKDNNAYGIDSICLLYTSPSPRDA